MRYIKWFNELTMADIGLVGGKNASLGQMIQALSPKGLLIPNGFALTSDAYWYVLEHNHLLKELKDLMAQFTKIDDIALLQRIGHNVRLKIREAEFPVDLVQEITQAYEQLSQQYGQKAVDVAVRSSATAEDLPQASFAGQQETFLNINGTRQLIEACKKSMASLFTNRAIIYRIQQNFDHFKVALSVGVQKMVRSDLACSGVAFSLDTESGFKDVIVIDAAYGLGDPIVQGNVVPDEFYVHKPTLEQGYRPIVKKYLGSKKIKRIYAKNGHRTVVDVPVIAQDQHRFCLMDDEILLLAKQVVIIESYYSDINKRWSPMDIEWAKDGLDGNIYILQARPETVYSQRQNFHTITQYELVGINARDLANRVLVTGQSVGEKIASGRVRILSGPEQIDRVQQGDIVVTYMTDPDWVPIMKKAAAIVTDSGGRTCHAAIVSRELGIPAIIGTDNATQLLQDGSTVTIDCSRGKTGYIYDGALTFKTNVIKLEEIPKSTVEIMLNIGVPDRAYNLASLPVTGVGLARTEFLIADHIGCHPMAIIYPDMIDKKVRHDLEQKAHAFGGLEEFFVSRLARGIGTIAAAFYPRPVIVRFSDFKSNEYRNLPGGEQFEPVEENPMIGFRGASRYYNEKYAPAFALECKAYKRAREVMGFKNIKLMIPFVRTVTEAQKVQEAMHKNGLVRGQDGLELVMMCEIPSNVICIDRFCEYFDGFSIGSNDLTQTTLAVDRDSELLAALFDERDPAVKAMMCMAIEGAHKHKRFIGICGQAPSDYPEIAEFLVCQGIDSLSLNDDTVLSFLLSCGPCRSKGLYCKQNGHSPNTVGDPEEPAKLGT